MRYLELTLSLLLPVLLLIVPTTLPFLYFSDIVLCWLCVVLLLALYSATFLTICTPQLTKPTTRWSNIKTYFTKEVLLLGTANLIFSYFLSGLINIWYKDPLHDNLALFWCVVTSQYFMFHSLINYSYKYTNSIIRLQWSDKMKLNCIKWLQASLKQSFKIVRIVLPIYFLFYKDLTALTSTVCGSPETELTHTFLFRPTTCANILITTFLTHVLLSVGYNVVLHVLSRGDIPKVKGRTSIEKCVESLKSENTRRRYDAMTALLRVSKSSYNARQTIFSLQDGHPVLWHIIYKEWVDSMTKFSKSIFDKPVEVTETVPAKTESSIKPGVGRALGVESKPTYLYSIKDTAARTTDTPAAGSQFSTLLSNVANDAAVTFKQTAKDYFLASRIGKYMLTEQSELVYENKLEELRLMLDLSDMCGLLCCAAPAEDKYGVVQLVLPDILNTVTVTLKAIEQVPIIGSNMSHTRLKRSLQMFLYHVTDTYESSLFNLTLNIDTTLLLQQYYTTSKDL